MLAIDVGMLMTARNQAQNAADAGAGCDGARATESQAGGPTAERCQSQGKVHVMNNRLRRLVRNDSGMSYVFIGMGMTAFLSASMLAIDVGMLMTARNQAQNAADAGALAGATALLYDNWNDRSPSGPAVTSAIAAATNNKVMAGVVSVNAADVEFPLDPAGRADARQGHGAPHGVARQSGLDADCAVLRDRHRRHRRHRDRRGLAGQRDDLREAVHRSRSLEGEADAALGRRRHLRRVRQQGTPARQPGHLHSCRPAGYTGYNQESMRGQVLTIRAATGSEHHGQLLLLAGARQTGHHRRRGIRLEHRQLQQDHLSLGRPADPGARRDDRPDHLRRRAAHRAGTPAPTGTRRRTR